MQILKTRTKFSHLLQCCNVCSSSCECGVFKFVHFTVLSILITLILPNAHWFSQCSRMTLQLSENEAVSFGILIHCLKSSFDTLSNILPFSDLKESWLLLGKYLNTLDFSNSSFTTIWRSFLDWVCGAYIVYTNSLSNWWVAFISGPIQRPTWTMAFCLPMMWQQFYRHDE